MGCNAEQAKIKINEILTRSQIDSDPKSLELVNKKTDAFASIIDNKIKKQFIIKLDEKRKSEYFNRYSGFNNSYTNGQTVKIK